MANFRATIKGNRGSASRLGHKTTGISASVNGWNLGVSVYGFHENGEDKFKVELTSGSNGGERKMIGTFTASDLLKLAKTAVLIVAVMLPVTEQTLIEVPNKTAPECIEYCTNGKAA